MKYILILSILFSKTVFALSPTIVAKIAEEMYSDGEYNKAINKCKEALAIDPENAKCTKITSDSKAIINKAKQKNEANIAAQKKKVEEKRAKAKQEESHRSNENFSESTDSHSGEKIQLFLKKVGYAKTYQMIKDNKILVLGSDHYPEGNVSVLIMTATDQKSIACVSIEMTMKGNQSILEKFLGTLNLFGKEGEQMAENLKETAASGKITNTENLTFQSSGEGKFRVCNKQLM